MPKVSTVLFGVHGPLQEVSWFRGFRSFVSLFLGGRRRIGGSRALFEPALLFFFLSLSGIRRVEKKRACARSFIGGGGGDGVFTLSMVLYDCQI